MQQGNAGDLALRRIAELTHEIADLKQTIVSSIGTPEATAENYRLWR